MVKHATGGQFLVEDAVLEQPRVDGLEISPTGPMVGKKTPPTSGVAAEMEADALAAAGLDRETARRLGPGGRRPLRHPLDPAARVAPAGPAAYRVHVTLPAGAYATVLLDELVKPADGPLTRVPLA
jgi:tRNA pseudouridine13 synthase